MIKKNILITCGAGIYTRSITEVLIANYENINIILCDSSSASILFVQKEFKTYKVPSAENVSKDLFINSIKKIVIIENISFILPMSDKEAIYLKRSEYGSITLSADKNLCELFANKFSTITNLNRIFNENYLIRKIKKESVLEIIFNLEKNMLYCIKPNEGRGGKGFKIFGEKSKLESKYYSNFIETKDVFNYISNFSTSDEFILMEYFQGEDFNIDVSCKDGYLYDISIQKREAPINGPLILGEIQSNEIIYEFIKNLIFKVRASGIFNIELILKKVNGDKFKPIIYEINPRPSAAISFTEATNPGYLERAIKLIEGKLINPSPFINNKNVKIRRVWINEIV